MLLIGIFDHNLLADVRMERVQRSYLFSGVNKVELEELSIHLEDRTFVDYFNIFLSLPVSIKHQTGIKMVNSIAT